MNLLPDHILSTILAFTISSAPFRAELRLQVKALFLLSTVNKKFRRCVLHETLWCGPLSPLRYLPELRWWSLADMPHRSQVCLLCLLCVFFFVPYSSSATEV